MLRKLFYLGAMAIGVLVSSCGESTDLTAVAPVEQAEISSISAVVTTTTIMEEMTNSTGTTKVTLFYPTSANIGDEVTVTALIEFSVPRRARIEATATGEGIDLDLAFNSGFLGCAFFSFTECTIESTFEIPPDASINQPYLFEATVIPRGFFTQQNPPEVTISGQSMVMP